MKKIAIAAAVAIGVLFAADGFACDKHDGTAKPKQELVEQGSNVQMAFDAKPKVGTKAKCPVMGAEFTVKESSEHSTYKGKHYVFCCKGCKPKFDKTPEKFLK